MKQNIDVNGRVIRGVFALILLVLAFIYGSWLALAVSIFVFFEAFSGWCVVNQLLGRNECRK